MRLNRCEEGKKFSVLDKCWEVKKLLPFLVCKSFLCASDLS